MADEQSVKVYEILVEGPQGAGNTFALAPALTPIAMSERLPKRVWQLKEFPRNGMTVRSWVAAAAAALIAFAGAAPSTLALGDGDFDLGGQAIVLNVNGGALTIDINGANITHSAARVFEFQNAKGGGIVGKGKITGPHSFTGYQIKTTDCEDMVFEDFAVDHGNSGVECFRSRKIRMRRITFTNMYGPAFKSWGDNSWGVEATDCTLTNGAGFMGYAERGGNYVTMERCKKTLDLATLTTYLTGQLEYATTEAGQLTQTAFLGEEGFGGTADTKGHKILNCTFEFIGDNGISFTSTDSVARGCVVRWAKHDGGHSYNRNNRFEGCSFYDCGKYTQEIDPDTGNVISSTPTTGFGCGIRPNAGGCAYGNQVIGCLAIDCRKGGFNAGNDLLYRSWVSGAKDVPNTAPEGQPSNAVDNVKDYCKVDIGDWTLVWTAGAPGNQVKDIAGPVPTEMGTVSATAYGITIDPATGQPTNARDSNWGYVWWNDGKVWWYWRSSCPKGRGPWAADNVFRGNYSNHPDPERRYVQDPQVPADANNSWELPSILSIGANVYIAENTFTGATLSETVSVKSTGANTGNGTCVLDIATPRLAGVQPGRYTLRCTVATAGGGTFTLYDPFGVIVGAYPLVGGTVTTAAQIKAVITAGLVDYVLGDGWDVWILHTFALTSGSYGKLNASAPVAVNRITTPLGFVYHEVLLRNGNSQPWTLYHDDDRLRLPGNLDVTLGYKDWIRLLQVAQSGEQIWMAVGCSVQNLSSQSYAQEATLAGATNGVLSIGNNGLAVLNFTGNVTSVLTTVAGRQRIILRGTTGCDVTFVNSSNLRLEGVEGGTQTFRVRGRNNYIELLKLSVSGTQVWMQVGGYQTP